MPTCLRCGQPVVDDFVLCGACRASAANGARLALQAGCAPGRRARLPIASSPDAAAIISLASAAGEDALGLVLAQGRRDR